MTDRVRVVHLPTDLGMRAYSLNRAENEQGIESSVVLRQGGVHSSDSVRPLHSSSRVVLLWRLFKAFVRSLRADVVMANSGSTLLDFPSVGMDLADVPLYRALGKKLVVTYQGCDIRPCSTCPVRASLPEGEMCVNVPASFDYQQFDRLKERRFGIWERHANAILGITPDLCRTTGVHYTPHAKYIEGPRDRGAPAPRRRTDGRVRIAHMPKPHIKGSELIQAQVNELVSKFGDRVEYVPIAGVSWRTCLEMLTSCDVLIDQVLMGWYGGISVEAALLGVLPVAYIDEDLLQYVPEEMRHDLPVLSLPARDELPSLLERLIDDPEWMCEEQRRCTASARRFHEAGSVARSIAREHYGPRRSP